MGLSNSKIYDDFEFGRYWIGLDVAAAKKGLTLHFKNRSVLTLSQQNLLDLLNEENDKNRITIVYNPKNMKTTRVVVG
jgi:hypothetical protein